MGTRTAWPTDAAATSLSRRDSPQRPPPPPPPAPPPANPPPIDPPLKLPLPLVVVLPALGVKAGVIPSTVAAALVVGGLVTVVCMPIAGLRRLARATPAAVV